MSTKIKSWSYSRLSVFETCKLRAKLQYIDRIPDPTPKKAADRGTAIHQMGEDFVNGKITTLPNELLRFSDEFHELRERYQAGLASLEGEWGYDENWTPVDYDTAWLRVKCDAVVWLSPTECVVIDYKTGKRFGNEIKHGEQTMMYAAAVAARYPEVEVIHTELWYLDIDELAYNKFPRDRAMQALARFHRRGEAITTTAQFPANPNIHSCKWCPYKPEPAGTGHCEVGFVG